MKEHISSNLKSAHLCSLKEVLEDFLIHMVLFVDLLYFSLFPPTLPPSGMYLPLGNEPWQLKKGGGKGQICPYYGFPAYVFPSPMCLSFSMVSIWSGDRTLLSAILDVHKMALQSVSRTLVNKYSLPYQS